MIRRRDSFCLSLVLVLFFSFVAVTNVVLAAEAHDIVVVEVFFLVSEVKAGALLQPQITVRNNGTSGTETGITVNVYYNSSYPTTISDTLIDTYTIASLAQGAQDIRTVTWDTTGRSEGQYLVKAVASPVPGETDLSDNEKSKGVNVIEHDVAVTRVWAGPTGASAGQTVAINATVKNQGISTETFEVGAFYENSTHSIQVASNQTVTSLAVGGTQNLTFTWDTTGLKSDSYAVKVAAEVVSGEVIKVVNNIRRSTDEISYGVVRIPAVHDVAVDSASLAPSIVVLGDIVTISVIVENQGDSAETFDVTPYYGSQPATPPETVTLGSRNNTALPYTTKLVTFNWDTTSLPFGNYSITVVISQVAGETDTADNTYSSALLRVITPTIYYAPAKVLALAGENATVKIMVGYGPEVYSWQVLMYFDNSKVQVLSAVEGDFLGGPSPDTFFSANIRNDLGRAFISCTIMGGIPPATGSGWLSTIKLNFLTSSDSILNMTNPNTLLSDDALNVIPTTPQNGEIIQPWPEDLNLDGLVDIFDLATVAINYGNTGSDIQPPEADINGDNVVNITDLAMVAIKYGEYAPYY